MPRPNALIPFAVMSLVKTGLRPVAAMLRPLRRTRAAVRNLSVVHANMQALALSLARLEAGSAAAVRGENDWTSCLCTQAGCRGETFERWCAKLGEPSRFHRKLWEWVFIAETLTRKGMLGGGHNRRACKGLGFGVGQEPLVAAFAAAGCDILATDLDAGRAADAGWVRTGQHAAAGQLNDRRLCPEEDFRRRVAFRTVDMNDIPADLGGFDFCWSSCCLEHLGDLHAGLRFIERSLDCLRPGGVAVHTTEFNLSSPDRTVESGPTVIYRRRDIEQLVERLTGLGHHVAPIDWSTGNGVLDGFVDIPPYAANPHLRLALGKYVSTSIGLIVTKSACEPR